MSNIIDLSKLPISDGKQVINIIGLNDNGNIIRAEKDTYSKAEIDEKVANVKVDLTGYATEQWVRRQGYVTDSDVNDYVGNEIGQVEERFNDYYTKTEVDNIVSNIDVSGGSGDSGVYVFEPFGDLEGRVESSTTNYETWENTTEIISRVDDWQYEGSKRQAHNIEIVKAIREGKCKSLLIKHKIGSDIVHSEYTDIENGSVSVTTFGDRFMLIPLTVVKEIGEWTNGMLTINGYYQINGDIGNTEGLTLLSFQIGDDGNVMFDNRSLSPQPQVVSYDIYYDDVNSGYKLDRYTAEGAYDNIQNNKCVLFYFNRRVTTEEGLIRHTSYFPVHITRIYTNGVSSYDIWGMFDEKTIIKWYIDGNQQPDEWGNYESVLNEMIPLGGGSGDSYTKAEIDGMIGDINNILTSI